jgi:two-component system sensor histidine kinase KdpD
VPIDDLALVLRGRVLPAEDRRVLAAFAAQAAVALRQRGSPTRPPRPVRSPRPTGPGAPARRGQPRPARAARLGQGGGHRAAQPGRAVEGRRAGRAAGHRRRVADRLTRLVNNLLDMSRLQAGALAVHPVPVGVDDVMPAVLAELGPASRAVRLRLPDDLPELHADAVLLERILANLLGNALRHSPADRPPLLSGSTFGDRSSSASSTAARRGEATGSGSSCLPAPRRHRQHHRCRVRPRPVPRAWPRHGRHAGAGEHPWWRAHLVLRCGRRVRRPPGPRR